MPGGRGWDSTETWHSNGCVDARSDVLIPYRPDTDTKPMSREIQLPWKVKRAIRLEIQPLS